MKNKEFFKTVTAQLNDKFRKEVIQNPEGFITHSEKITQDGLVKKFPYHGLNTSASVVSGIGKEPKAFRNLLELIKDYNHFPKGNDPYGEHDMGFIKKFKWFKRISVSTGNYCRSKTKWEKQETDFWWKIDCYDLKEIENGKEFGSPNPADDKVTKRIMTIYLPEEH